MDEPPPRTSSRPSAQRPRRLSLASAGSASSARKALLFADPAPGLDEPRPAALGDVSLGALNSALSSSRLSAASECAASPPRAAGASTPCSSAEPTETYAPRSVLRRRTPGGAAAPHTGGGRISFGPGVVDTSPASSLVKHSPRPPRWPAAQSPWLQRGEELLDDVSAPWDTPGGLGADTTWANSHHSGAHHTASKSQVARGTPAGGDADRAVQNELLAMRTAYCNMCAVVFLGAMGLLLYAQGILVSQYYKPLVLAGFVGTALRRPCHYVASTLRWQPPEAADSSAASDSATSTAAEDERGDMPEWAYWRWLGAAYLGFALLRFPGSTVMAGLIMLSLYSTVTAVLRALKDTWIARELRQQISDWRHVLAKTFVVASFFLVVILGLSLCAYHLVAELDMLRSFALGGSMHSHTLAAVHRLSGWSEEDIATIVREKSSMASDYMRGQFEDLIGDKQLAREVAVVVETFVIEALHHNITSQRCAAVEGLDCSAGGGGGGGVGVESFALNFSSFQEVYDAALGSSLLLSEHTHQLFSRLWVHTWSLLIEGVGYALAGIDFLFACTLFSSWLWMCLDEDVIETTIDRVIVGTDTAMRVKSVLDATAGILDSLAHTFIFHACLAWLIFAASSIRLHYMCTLLAGFLSITPVFSPWAVIFGPLALRILTTVSAADESSISAVSTILTIGSELSRVELCAWTVSICAWVSGRPQRLLSRSIATRTHHLLGETRATQAILLGFYAFGVPGIAAGPVLLALTNGLVKIYRDSVVFPLRCTKSK